ncbi:SCP2 sterol-binding domain protein [Kalmanozyma brasiliensis GHG001]|uniref:SCP2 domain-containing protein n=1 Tax=Kalmanozyma brasiliensis (strain GHG001) TaxID=1365824 RepID=V5EYH5_KALBG|nr:SCP2 sterol-binding domain protein [Kalmanozyma brasiliensis GHG001]EST07794.1 SCP2 sterol-binding domain protein [Kalmanozyma brasiliensis GHG001]
MGKNAKSEDEINLFQIILDQADDIDFSDPSKPLSDHIDPTALKIPGFEVSKLFAVVYWGLLHSEDEEGFMAGLDMMNMSQAKKAVNGVFVFNVKPSSESAGKETVQFYVDMKKEGKIEKGSGPARPKPDCVFTISDRDMIRVALGQLSPQVAFMKGKVKVKGNIMLGLRMQTVLMSEVKKMSRVAKL